MIRGKLGGRRAGGSAETRGLDPRVQPASASPSQRFTIALGRGATLQAAANIAGVSLEQAQVMVEHFRRLGTLIQANQTAGSTGCVEGACHTPVEQLSDQQRLHCAGCPLW